MNFKSLFSAFAAVILLGSTAFSATVVASTPDGETPANEGVCDVLIGATPGLFGLCNAYCEAQDLDDFDKEPPRTKILANYNKKKKAGDPDMPCLQVPCPCWSSAELGAMTADGTASACLRSGETTQLIDDAPSLRFARSDQTGRCTFVDTNAAPPTVRNFNITGEEAASCHAQVEQACADVGL